MGLYHGTSCTAIQAITRSGFEMPLFPGMFGAAIYFADTPLKSWQYVKGAGNYMLVCDVLLGRMREMRSAAHDLRLSSLRNALSFTPTEQHFEHDSVCGITREQGGSLR